MEIQMRSETNGMSYADTFEKAFQIVAKDETIWKISFVFEGNCYRLLRSDSESKWENRPMRFEGDSWKIDVSEVHLPENVKNLLMKAGFNV